MEWFLCSCSFLQNDVIRVHCYEAAILEVTSSLKRPIWDTPFVKSWIRPCAQGFHIAILLNWDLWLGFSLCFYSCG